MVMGLWRRAGQWAAASLAALVLVVGKASADDKEMIEQLKARVEALEKQNQELLRRFDALQPPTGQQQPPGGTTGPTGEGGRRDVEAADVRQLVAEYLKDQEAAKKKEGEQKKKEAEEQGFVVGNDLGMTARWNHGLMLETADKAFRIHPVGRLHVDSAWMNASDAVQFGPGGVGRVDDGIGFRRVRAGVEGTIWEVFNFWFEPDFFNTFNANTGSPGATPLIANTAATTDLWAEITHLPLLGTIRFGSVKPAISLEHLTSSRFLDYLERSLPFDAFIGGLDNGFQPGLVVYNQFCDRRLFLQGSVTKNNQNLFGFNVGDGEYSLSGRIVGLPWYDQEGRCFLHVGLAGQHRDLDEDQVRFRGRTEVRNGPAALHTALVDLTLLGQSEDLLVPEIALVRGPLTIAAEYYRAWVQGAAFPLTPVAARRNLGTVSFQGAYVNVMYFLTGEHRPYDRNMGIWTRVVPIENFFLVQGDRGKLFGRGAWQIGARYSFLDLDDGEVQGGIVHSLTLGLNWFLNPNMKWQLNYTIDRRDVSTAASNGIVQGLGLRYALDF